MMKNNSWAKHYWSLPNAQQVNATGYKINLKLVIFKFNKQTVLWNVQFCQFKNIFTVFNMTEMEKKRYIYNTNVSFQTVFQLANINNIDDAVMQIGDYQH